MARIAYTLGVTALILAGIVSARCVTEHQQGLSDIHHEQLSIVEQFQQSARNDDASPEQSSPLIKQAEMLALYLNPPRPPQRTPEASRPQRPPQPVVATKTKPVTAIPKFELGGISYHRSKPEESRALLREPGGSYRWVRQGAQWGHVVIVEIKGDSIVYADGGDTRQMAFVPNEASTAWAQNPSPRTHAAQRPTTGSSTATRMTPALTKSPATITDSRIAAANYRETTAQQNRRRYEQNARLMVRAQ